jgi:hypothetical protein
VHEEEGEGQGEGIMVKCSLGFNLMGAREKVSSK